MADTGCGIRPLGDRVVVRPTEPETVTLGGIVLPGGSQEKPSRGPVLASGKDSSVSVGDIVIFSRYGGTEIEHDGESLLVLRESDIFAVIVHD